MARISAHCGLEVAAGGQPDEEAIKAHITKLQQAAQAARRREQQAHIQLANAQTENIDLRRHTAQALLAAEPSVMHLKQVRAGTLHRECTRPLCRAAARQRAVQQAVLGGLGGLASLPAPRGRPPPPPGSPAARRRQCWTQQWPWRWSGCEASWRKPPARWAGACAPGAGLWLACATAPGSAAAACPRTDRPTQGLSAPAHESCCTRAPILTGEAFE